MTDHLRQLYQDTILEHTRKPCNYGALEGATHRADGYNPACGDTVNVELLVQGGRLRAVRFTGEGCSISQASASMMTQALAGKTLEEAQQLLEAFLKLLAGEDGRDPETLLATYGDLAALAGVRQFPQRIKCATLAWHALEAALKGGQADGSTPTP